MEGDLVPLSIVPRVWQVLRHRLQAASEQIYDKSLMTRSETDSLMSFVDNRIKMNQLAVHCASAIVDPRFNGIDLEISDVDLAAAENVLITITHNKGIEQEDILNDLAQYRARRGPYCAVNRVHMWDHASSLQIDPCLWWSSYTSGRPLSKVASILLSLPCKTAAVERGNKAYSMQKTKRRNRLTDDRSAALTNVAYNLLSNKSQISEPGAAKQRQKTHTALLMPTSSTPAPEIIVSDSRYAHCLADIIV